MIQVKNLHLMHKKDLRPILDDFSFALNPGDKAVVIGEEGNGKSTLLKWLVNPSLVEDYVEAEGERITGGARIGYLPQELPAEEKERTLYEFFCEEEQFFQWSPKELSKLAQELGLPADFYYDGKIGEWSLDFDGNAIWQTADSDNRTQEETTDAGGTFSERTVTTLSNTDYKFYAGKLVLQRPLLGGNLTIGAEYGHLNRQTDYRNPEGVIASTVDEIKEGNAAAFAEYARSLGKVYAQVGIRYEYDNFDYTLNGKHMDEQSKVYHNVFPSASLVLPVGKAQLMLQYRGEIKRPYYSMLSSSISYVNRYTYESGNPLLRPVLTQSVSLGASYQWLTLQAGYQHIKDDFFDTSEPYSDADPTIALMSKRNAPEYDALFVSASAAPTIGFWSPVLSASLSKQWLETEAPGGTINADHPLFMLGWGNDFKLPAGFLLTADMRWMTTGDSQNTRILDHMWTMNASLYKEVWDGRMSFQLKANDIFNTQKMNGLLYTGSVRTLRMFNEPNAQSVSLTVRYKFNATKSKYKGTGAGDAQKNRM